MSEDLTRRSLLASAGVAGLLTAMPLGRAFAQSGPVPLVAVEWGGEIVDAMKQIAARQADATFDWVLHQGGAAAILPQIKAAWPEVAYDYVAGWEGSFNSMIAEDWLETIDPADVPNLADLPQNILLRDAAGNIKAVPRAVGGMYFGYRSDISPVSVASVDDLFSPDLRGQICWPGPTQSMMLQIVALALHAGGSEKDMDPGWKLMADLAKSGNIGRVAGTDVDFTNSLTSGETSVGFFAEPGWAAVAAHFPVSRLTKSAAMKTFMYQSGFGVMKNRPNKAAVLKFIDFAISPEMSALYADVAGEAPLNIRTKAPEKLAHLAYGPGEFEQFVYVPDYGVVLAEQDNWARRWEEEIAPLL